MLTRTLYFGLSCFVQRGFIMGVGIGSISIFCIMSLLLYFNLLRAEPGRNSRPSSVSTLRVAYLVRSNKMLGGVITLDAIAATRALSALGEVHHASWHPPQRISPRREATGLQVS